MRGLNDDEDGQSPHPGEIIKGLWLDSMGVSITDAAQAMAISRKTLSKIVNARGRVTPEIAVRLSIALGSRALVHIHAGRHGLHLTRAVDGGGC